MIGTLTRLRSFGIRLSTGELRLTPYLLTVVARWEGRDDSGVRACCAAVTAGGRDCRDHRCRAARATAVRITKPVGASAAAWHVHRDRGRHGSDLHFRLSR